MSVVVESAYFHIVRVDEVRAALGLEDSLVADRWSDSQGCWADVWHEQHREYLSCDKRPDPDSELGLCPQHEAKMQQLKEAS